MKKRRKEIAEFYKQILSDHKLKEKIVEKARQIKNEEDLRRLIREEIVPLMKKFKVNFSEEELLNYEKEALKVLSENDLKNVSGGSISVKSLMAPGLMAVMLMGFSAAAPQSEAMFNEVDNRPQVSWFTKLKQNISYLLWGSIPQEVFYKLASELPSYVINDVNECVSDGENLYKMEKIDGSNEVWISLFAKKGQTKWKIPAKVYDIYGNQFAVGGIEKNYRSSMESLEEITTDKRLKKLKISFPTGLLFSSEWNNLKMLDIDVLEEVGIGVAAFAGCPKLEKVYCSGKTVTISSLAFCKCPNIKEFELNCITLKAKEGFLAAQHYNNEFIKLTVGGKTYRVENKNSQESYNENNFNDTEETAQSSYNGNDAGNDLQRLLFSSPQNTNNDSGTGNSVEDTKWEESSVPKTADINAVAGRKKVKPVPKYENPFSVLSDDEDYE